MTITEKTLAQDTIGSTEETIYTGTATDVVKIIWLCNVTASDATVELWLVPNGSSSADANKLLNGITVPANDFVQISTYIPMETTGDFIRAKCSTDLAVTINLFGASIT